MKISTHTLTWSVTVGYLISKYCLKDFNSHAHVERDIGSVNSGKDYIDFNSHAHVERDLYPQHKSCHDSHFNSHAHVERDIRR